jgi:predicted DNA-binding WGR domain protein
MQKPTQLQLPFSSMSLHRIDAGSNCHRFYALDVERDLFGQTLLARRWGRIGTYGRARYDEYPDTETAHAALAALALAKQRRGYQDRMLYTGDPPKPRRGGHDDHSSDRISIDAMTEPPLPF